MPAQPLRTANRPPALQTGLADPIMLSHGEACALIETPADGLDDLLARAGEVRDRGRGRTVTFSKKVFVPLTTLCRDYCGYCTFRRDPGEPGAHTMTPDEVVALVQAGQRLGAKEALFSLGDKPEVPFAPGILVGIGEVPRKRGDALCAIRGLHERYGHVQEVIVQNFRAKPRIPMRGQPEPTLDDVLRTLAVARLVLGPDVNIQAPPNLTPGVYPPLLAARLNDWGGISPLTIEHIHSAAP